MRKVFLVMLALLVASAAFAQVKVYSHNDLWPTNPDSMKIGNTLSEYSETITFMVTAPDGRTQFADNAWVELSGKNKADDDSLLMYLIGIGIGGDCTRVYLDTLTIPVKLDTMEIVAFSPTIFPLFGKVALTGEAATAGDTTGFEMRIIVEADEGE